VLATYSHTLSVSGFDPSLGSIPNIKIAKIAVAYDCPFTLDTFILLFDQVLLVPSLQVNLLCVGQLRDQGIVVNAVLLQRLCAADCNAASHCILEGTSGLRIPLDFHRPISSFS